MTIKTIIKKIKVYGDLKFGVIKFLPAKLSAKNQQVYKST